MRRSLSIITVSVFSLTLGLAGCGTKSSMQSSDSSSASTSSSTSASTSTLLSGMVNDHGTQTVTGTQTVELDDNYFEPTYLKATAGQSMTLMLKNTGKMGHTFTSPALNTDVKLSPGESKTITVMAPQQAGTTEFDCTYHSSLGMRGAVIVG